MADVPNAVVFFGEVFVPNERLFAADDEAAPKSPAVVRGADAPNAPTPEAPPNATGLSSDGVEAAGGTCGPSPENENVSFLAPERDEDCESLGDGCFSNENCTRLSSSPSLPAGRTPKAKGRAVLLSLSVSAAGAGGVGRVAGEIPRKFFRSGVSPSSSSDALTKGLGSNGRFPMAEEASPKVGMAPPEKSDALLLLFFFGVLICPNGYGLMLAFGTVAGAANVTLGFDADTGSASPLVPLSLLLSSSTNSSRSSSSAGSTAGDEASPSAGGDGFPSVGSRTFLSPDDIAIPIEREIDIDVY